MVVPNSMDATLRHFYPHLPPGMAPFSTTDEQTKIPDEWRDKTGNEYEVSIRKVDPRQVSLHLTIESLRKCEKDHKSWCKQKIPPLKKSVASDSWT
jgi:hypothetical protein